VKWVWSDIIMMWVDLLADQQLHAHSSFNHGH
jgi:hypothetical protein